ncbi:hypothetical protein FKM82_022443 [Ascaphus truei]
MLSTLLPRVSLRWSPEGISTVLPRVSLRWSPEGISTVLPRVSLRWSSEGISTIHPRVSLRWSPEGISTELPRVSLSLCGITNSCSDQQCSLYTPWWLSFNIGGGLLANQNKPDCSLFHTHQLPVTPPRSNQCLNTDLSAGTSVD